MFLQEMIRRDVNCYRYSEHGLAFVRPAYSLISYTRNIQSVETPAIASRNPAEIIMQN